MVDCITQSDTPLLAIYVNENVCMQPEGSATILNHVNGSRNHLDSL